jgi:hypothetical protein
VPEPVVELVREFHDRYNDQASELASGELAGRVAQLAPPDGAPLVDPLERRPRRMVDAVALGAATIYGAATTDRVGLLLGPPGGARLAVGWAA